MISFPIMHIYCCNQASHSQPLILKLLKSLNVLKLADMTFWYPIRFVVYSNLIRYSFSRPCPC